MDNISFLSCLINSQNADDYGLTMVRVSVCEPDIKTTFGVTISCIVAHTMEGLSEC